MQCHKHSTGTRDRKWQGTGLPKRSIKPIFDLSPPKHRGEGTFIRFLQIPASTTRQTYLCHTLQTALPAIRSHVAQACYRQVWLTAGGAHPCQHPEPTPGSHRPPPEVSRWKATGRQVRPTELLPNTAHAERLRDVCSNCNRHSRGHLHATFKLSAAQNMNNSAVLNYSLCRQFCREAFGCHCVDPTHLVLVSPVCTKLLLIFQQ